MDAYNLINILTQKTKVKKLNVIFTIENFNVFTNEENNNINYFSIINNDLCLRKEADIGVNLEDKLISEINGVCIFNIPAEKISVVDYGLKAKLDLFRNPYVGFFMNLYKNRESFVTGVSIADKTITNQIMDYELINEMLHLGADYFNTIYDLFQIKSFKERHKLYTPHKN